jgi:hypothetical protein
MNKQREKIRERIRKLLALSQSPYEAEAASALEKAQKLLTREDFTLSDPGVDESVLVELRIGAGPIDSPWEKKLLKGILSATCTEASLQRGRGKERPLLFATASMTWRASDSGLLTV